jgi:hypothetical protein
MAAVRRALPLLLLVLALAACGGSSKPKQAGLGSAATTKADTAHFSLAISAIVGGRRIVSNETGSLSFAQRRAHLYKLVPGGGLPQEIVVVGPYSYTNANVEAALKDSSVKPWTKLDNRRLTAKQRNAHPDELAHVRALAYLADGVSAPKRLGTETVGDAKTTRYHGTVDPARIVAHAPAAQRAELRRALGDDYPAHPFPADFWLDANGGLRRVLVVYRTPGGIRITIDGGFSEFGTKLDLTLPAATEIQDITP